MKTNITSFKTKIMIIITSLFLTACDNFLDEKSDAKLAIPETFDDLRAMMNNYMLFNTNFPALMEAGADDYYAKENIVKAQRESEQLIYTWKSSLYRSEMNNWFAPYTTILNSNVVLEGLIRIKDGTAYNRQVVEGEARFVRAYAYYFLSQIFCLPYDEANQANLLGLPLRTSSDHSIFYPRASMKETYDFIIAELKAAAELLPDQVEYSSFPSKPAALGALARIYLIMGEFKEANNYAIKTLAYNNKLLNFNELNTALANPLPKSHREIIYDGLAAGTLTAQKRAYLPKDLYENYNDNDLRKTFFFKELDSKEVQFRGTYNGDIWSYFPGIAVDELYLICAEYEVREGSVDEGLKLLNSLLKNRYITSSYVDYANLNREEALNLVLAERRKELIRRGIRWTDLRRLLKEPGRVPTLYRKADNGIDNAPYNIAPNGRDYTYPIPPEVLELENYTQNEI